MLMLLVNFPANALLRSDGACGKIKTMEGQPPASAMPSPAGASKPAAAAPAPGAKPASPRRNNLRHITVVALLGALALGVSGAIIYFTLHVTGVIENITQNSSTTLTAEEQADENFADECARYRARLDAFGEGTDDEAETLETDLQNFLGRTINDYGKDSDEATEALFLLTEYYELTGGYDHAKEYLEDRISVADDDDQRNRYVAELYRLATVFDDDETANYYLGQINDETDPQIKSAKLQALSYQLLANYLRNVIGYDDADDENAKEEMDEETKSECGRILMEIRSYARAAEAAYPTADTAYLLATIETYSENEEKAAEYMKLATERDPNKYAMPQEGSNSDGQ